MFEWLDKLIGSKNMAINLEEYEMKDNESNYTGGIQLSIYDRMIYKQTFKPTEEYDVSLVSLRMAMFNNLDSTPVNVVVTVTNTDTEETCKYVGIPEGYTFQHGLLPWVHMPLEKSVHFKPGQKGEIIISSDGHFEIVNGISKGKGSVIYIRRDPLTYLNGEFYRWQYWNKSWFKLLFHNKPYVATFRLWKKIQETVPDIQLEITACPSCGFVFPPDSIETINPISKPSP